MCTKNVSNWEAVSSESVSDWQRVYIKSEDMERVFYGGMLWYWESSFRRYGLNGFRCPSANIILVYTDRKKRQQPTVRQHGFVSCQRVREWPYHILPTAYLCSLCESWLKEAVHQHYKNSGFSTDASEECPTRGHSQTVMARHSQRRLLITQNAYWTVTVMSVKTQDYEFNKTVSWSPVFTETQSLSL